MGGVTHAVPAKRREDVRPPPDRPNRRPPRDRSALLALQRMAGNAAVSALVARQQSDAMPPSGTTAAQQQGTQQPGALPPATVPPRKNYVFLMGDEVRDRFYRAARDFFIQHEPGAELVTGKRTLAEIIEHVDAGGVPVLKLFVVSHANEEGNLGFSLDAADLARDRGSDDHKPRTTFAEIRDANRIGALPRADVSLIDDFTKIEIKGCNIGRSQLMLDQLDTAFGGHGEVIAPTHKQQYSSRGRGASMVTEEAFLPYFIERPGAPAVSASEVAASFRAKYPDVPQSQWRGLLRRVRRHHEKEEAYKWAGVRPPADNARAVIARLHAAKQFPSAAGWVLTYNGRTVVGDDYRYELRAERMLRNGATEWQELHLTVQIPPDPAALIAREQGDFSRPDAHTWSVEDQVIGTRLIRRVFQERTEWTINRRVRDAAGTAHPPETDPTFYGHSAAVPAPAPATP